MSSGQEKKEIRSPNLYPSNISISLYQVNTWLGLVSPDEAGRAPLFLLHMCEKRSISKEEERVGAVCPTDRVENWALELQGCTSQRRGVLEEKHLFRTVFQVHSWTQRLRVSCMH